MPDRPASAFIRDARLSPTRPISVLTFSTLYPNREMPYLGIFVESRLRGLLRSGEAASMVVAPVPWFPFDKPMFGRYGAFARVPREELRHGIPVLHPRYPLLPKLGMSSAPFLMYAGLRKALAKILKSALRLRPDRCALRLPGRRGGGVARSEPRQASGDHGARHGHQPHLPLSAGQALDPLGGAASRWHRGGVRRPARPPDRIGCAGQPYRGSAQWRRSGAVCAP